MPARLTYTSLAEADLAALWSYVADHNHPATADRVLAQVRATAHKLADMPGMGRRRPELHPECRSFPVRPVVLFYRTIPGGVEILRVAHGARDAEQLF